MAAPSPRELLTFLQEHAFLTRPQIQQLAEALNSADTRALARTLVDRNWLSAYQANQLLQGRGRGLVVGGYRLLEPLGQGGMGKVFKAHQVRMERIVALKIISPEHVDNSNALSRFYREIRAIAQLSHPNIVTAYEANQDGDTFYLAMEFVDGIDLARLVGQSGPLPIAQACEFIRQAALGLQHAHEKGLVHRDIKPGNLMVTRSGVDGRPVVKILDFGLARFEDQATHGTRLTQLGKVLGTVDYISPEQAGDASIVDIRADIYSLGCSLFYLLTGKPPFEGTDSMERTLARLMKDAPAVGSLRADVPVGLEQVVGKMLARKVEERYRTPAQVTAALEPFAQTTPPSERTSSSRLPHAHSTDGIWEGLEDPVPVGRTVSRRRGGRWAGLLLLMLLALALGAWAFWKTTGPPARLRQNDLKNSLGMKFVAVPAGTFWMSKDGKNAQREVTLKEDFQLAVFPVTQGQWHSVMRTNPSHFSREGAGKDLVKHIPDAELNQFPVENVSWNDAQGLLNKLNERDKDSGWHYRLPTEAEWEYACRSGASAKADCEYDFYVDRPTNDLASTQANFVGGHPAGRAPKGPHLDRPCKVGSYKPNPWGFYDMHGNVTQTCEACSPDGVSGLSSPVVRGGSWHRYAQTCRAAFRNESAPDERADDRGFRLVRVPMHKLAP